MLTLEENKRLISLMIRKYCFAHHPKRDRVITGTRVPCEECRELETYAHQRLEKCPWGERKPTCSKCPVHCYKKEMRAKVIDVMKFSGPRVLFTNPILSFKYLRLKLKKAPTIEDLKSKTQRKVENKSEFQ